MATLNSQQLTKGLLTLDILIPVDELPSHFERAARELQQSRPLAGFRPGKASVEQVRHAYGEMALLERAVRFAVPISYAAIVAAEHLQTIGEPDIQVTKLIPGQPIIFSATVAVLPPVTLGDYHAVRVPETDASVTDEEVDKVIEDLREMRATEKIVDRAAKDGDIVTVSLTISKDGVPLEGGSAKDHRVELGKPYLIDGFTQELVGLKATEKKAFSLPFPKDHFDKNLAGQIVTYDVAITTVIERVKAPIDDAFVKSLGNFGTIAALRDQLRMNLGEMKTTEETTRRERAIIEAISTKTTFGDIPDVLVEAELQKILFRAKERAASQGIEWSNYLEHLNTNVEALKKTWLPEAEIRVKAALIVRAVADTEHITVSEEEISAERNTILEHYKNEDEAHLREEVQNPEYDSHLKHLILTRKVMSFLSILASGKT
ncbi:MAG: trigger factor [Patescibacteria group bacterium]|jgi:trigger factor